MKRLASITLALALAACGSKKPTTTTPPPGGDGSGSQTASGCPAPKSGPDACAQVITYAKAADGTCCQYPTPCSVPIEGQQYSDDKCSAPMGPAAK